VLVDGTTPSPARQVAELAVVPRVVGPHARLGVVWAGLTVVALVAGPVALAVLLAPAAAAAGHQAARSWRRQPRRAAPPLAAAGAGVLPLAALAGPLAVAAAAAALGAVLVAAALAVRSQRTAADPVLTGAVALFPGLAAAGPVLLRRDGLVAALVLLAYAAVYDTGAYVVGTGAARAWEATVAGMFSIGAVTLAVAAVLVPPFRGASPWALGALAAVLAPLGPLAGSALLGDRRARAPALRRLDSLLLLGPLWSLAAVLALQ
jgi:CDP-diglyceride synthetase